MKNNDEHYERLANLFSILSNPIRLRILDSLVKCCKPNNEGCCVFEINNEVELPQPYISKHLKILKESGLLKYERDGNKIIYSFNRNEYLNELLEFIKNINCC